jgi:hypothetical protein
VNQYAIQTSTGYKAGFIAENPGSIFTAIVRQMLRTRRQFSADILDANGNVVLKIERPIKLFLNSHISVFTPDGRLIGEVQQTWHLWRRQYDLFRKYVRLLFM